MISETTLIKGARLIVETCIHVEAGEAAAEDLSRYVPGERVVLQTVDPLRTFVEVSTWPTR